MSPPPPDPAPPGPPRRRRGAVVALAVLALALAACGDDEAGSADPAATTAVEAEGVATTEAAAAPERLDVVATDYDWSGLPDRIAPGSYPLTLRNEASQTHEVSVFLNPEELSLDELFALGPVDMGDHVVEAGSALVGPGATSEEATLVLEEGTYEVVCFIPDSGDQRPHYAHGMHRTIEVG